MQSTKEKLLIGTLATLAVQMGTFSGVEASAKHQVGQKNKPSQKSSLKLPAWQENIKRESADAALHEELGMVLALEKNRKAILLIALRNSSPGSKEEIQARENLKKFYEGTAANKLLNQYPCFAAQLKRFKTKDNDLLNCPRPELEIALDNYLRDHGTIIDRVGNHAESKRATNSVYFKMSTDGSVSTQDDRMVQPSCSLPPTLPLCKPGSNGFDKLINELPDLLPGGTQVVPVDKADQIIKAITAP